MTAASGRVTLELVNTSYTDISDSLMLVPKRGCCEQMSHFVSQVIPTLSFAKYLYMHDLLIAASCWVKNGPIQYLSTSAEARKLARHVTVSVISMQYLLGMEASYDSAKLF